MVIGRWGATHHAVPVKALEKAIARRFSVALRAAERKHTTFKFTGASKWKPSSAANAAPSACANRTLRSTISRMPLRP